MMKHCLQVTIFRKVSSRRPLAVMDHQAVLRLTVLVSVMFTFFYEWLSGILMKDKLPYFQPPQIPQNRYLVQQVISNGRLLQL